VDGGRRLLGVPLSTEPVRTGSRLSKRGAARAKPVRNGPTYVLRDQFKKKHVAELIARRALRDAPPSLLGPQVKELAALGVRDLLVLLKCEFPLDEKTKARFRSRLDKPDVLERLERRRHAASTIAKGRSADVYETEMHRTSGLDFWSSD
jgi:hypothetical protein